MVYDLHQYSLTLCNIDLCRLVLLHSGVHGFLARGSDELSFTG